jgi:hypothetical protein
MRRNRATLSTILLISAAVGSCVTAKQKREEEQELQRSIVQTSDPKAVQDCSFIKDLKPVAQYGSPETQTASLVVPKAGVEWTILEDSGGYHLYSCKAAEREPERAASRTTEPTPVVAPRAVSAPAPLPVPSPAAPVPVEASAPPASPAPPAPSAPAAEAPKVDSARIRVTNNPEAVRGCRFLASLTEYQSVSRFQDSVARTGGDVGYVVASNRDGEVIGESYRCAGP